MGRQVSELTLTSLTAEDASAIGDWRYAAPYDAYNVPSEGAQLRACRERFCPGCYLR